MHDLEPVASPFDRLTQPDDRSTGKTGRDNATAMSELVVKREFPC